MPDVGALRFTIPDLHAAYAQGLTPAAVLDEVFRRLEAAHDPGIFLSLADREALRTAATALGAFDPAAMPLWGIPVAAKDNIDVAGLPTTAACPDFAYTPDADAEAVARLRRAGAMIVGKTNLDQFATGLAGVRTPFPIPRNACDPALVPGGSSSGSAVAVARGIVPLALGTDTAGSGRVPAALNNIVGLKPSLGAVSTRGVVPACRTLDCVSILTLTVEDAAQALAAITGYDPGDPFSRRIEAPAVGRRPPVLRIGVPRPGDLEFFGDTASAAAFDAALDAAAALGATIVPIDFSGFFAVAALLYEGAWVAERYAAIRPLIETRPGSLHPVTREIIAGAARLSAADAFDGFYRLQALRRQLEPVWSGIDMLCVPSIPTPCSLAEIEADPIGANSRLGAYTNFVNLLDLCALAVPAGLRRDGRPGGVTLIGRAGDDGRIAALGSALHRRTTARLGATDWLLSAVPSSCPAPAVGLIELAVVGAHLSGMPLNGELTGRGAVFLRRARTNRDYRLFAIPGTTPPKPGLLRCGAGQGAEIEVEVWALTAAAFGRFVAAAPPPLSIGTLSLIDGSAVKGFLAEAEALREAEDISAYRGWRAYVEEGSGTARDAAA